MKDKVLLSTLIATIAATASFVLVNYLMGNFIDWQSAIIFIIVFAVVFDMTWRLRHWKKSRGRKFRKNIKTRVYITDQDA